MSVEFNEGDYSGFNSQQNSQTVGAIEKLVIKIGLAPDVRRARMVLVLIFVITLGVSIFLFLNINKSSSQSSVSKEIIMQSLQKTENSLIPK